MRLLPVSWERLIGFGWDAFYLRSGLTKRGRELKQDHLICDWCGEQIPLWGHWECKCGYVKAGRYFSRCPACLEAPGYINCPTCGLSRYVR